MSQNNKKITLSLRLVLTLLTIITVSVSLFLILFLKKDNYISLLVFVSTGIFLFNSTVLMYSMQPVSPFQKGEYIDFNNELYAVLGFLASFIIIFAGFFVFLPMAAFAKNTYRPALLIIITGCGSAAAYGLVTLICIKSKRHQKKVIGPIRVWMIALLIYGASGYGTWLLADYNPVLRHVSYSVTITRAKKFPYHYLDKICYLDVGWFHKEKNSYKCRARLFYEKEKIFGDLGYGAFNCRVFHKKDGSVDIIGGDFNYDDGDPAFILNTNTGYMLFKRRIYKNGVGYLQGVVKGIGQRP